MLFNKLLPTRTPQIVVRAKNDNDVMESVKFARANRLKISVHGGGHNWCGLAFRNGGMCIDLSKSVSQSTNFKALFDASGASWPEGVRAKVENVGYKSPPLDMFMAVKDHIVQAPIGSR
jgi:hypothetical protein